jgi:uncharacterized protein involved in cysteine biosynthesis
MVENIFKVELPDKEPRSSLKLIVSMFVVGLAKVFLFLTIGLICFIMSFIPGLNLLAPLIIVLTVAFDCMDYAFEVDFLNLRPEIRLFCSKYNDLRGDWISCHGHKPDPWFIFYSLASLYLRGHKNLYPTPG